YNGDGNADSITTYTYDGAGNQTSEINDYNGDGIADIITTYTYAPVLNFIAGTSLADNLNGMDEGDNIDAGEGNDTLFGGGASDVLNGGRGDDSLTGASSATNGVGEIDRLQGDAGADIFVLGTNTTTFYDDGDSSSQGTTDYALIADFDSSEDVIELSISQTYYLAGSPLGSVAGTGVFIDNDGTAGFSGNDELVGLLQGVSLTSGVITGDTAGFSLV
ncbi:MAG: hypothetical protein AAFQ80_16690, partial [Cyanobacteria bacterium J06621_8]